MVAVGDKKAATVAVAVDSTGAGVLETVVR
jgi:microcompartment protein CcmK/EutM